MGEFVFVVLLCSSFTTAQLTEVVQANNSSAAIAKATRLHPGWMACGTPRQLTK